MSLWSKNTKHNLTFTENNSDPKENKISNYANKLIDSDYSKIMLNTEYEKILNNGCIYLKNFFCSTQDTKIFENLKKELNINTNLVNWSKHYKCQNIKISKTCNDILKKMSEHFKVTIIETRVNYYKSGQDYKPFHHDKNAYGNTAEDFTMGASFGSTRQLEFLHVETNKKFVFPQNNGDIFAFTKDINKLFMHGIPKEINKGDRISIIAWGKIN